MVGMTSHVKKTWLYLFIEFASSQIDINSAHAMHMAFGFGISRNFRVSYSFVRLQAVHRQPHIFSQRALGLGFFFVSFEACGDSVLTVSHLPSQDSAAPVISCYL